MSAWQWLLVGIGAYLAAVLLFVAALRLDAWLVESVRRESPTVEGEALRGLLRKDQP